MKKKKQIRNKDLGVIQDDGEYIICDFVIYKDKNPELFKRNGEIMEKVGPFPE